MLIGGRIGPGSGLSTAKQDNKCQDSTRTHQKQIEDTHKAARREETRYEEEETKTGCDRTCKYVFYVGYLWAPIHTEYTYFVEVGEAARSKDEQRRQPDGSSSQTKAWSGSFSAYRLAVIIKVSPPYTPYTYGEAGEARREWGTHALASCNSVAF